MTREDEPDLPPKRKRELWNFHEMAIGDSVYSDRVNALRSAAWHYGRRNGIVFVSVKEGKGVRVWRKR